MRARGFKKLPFIAVVEATVNGWPHLHILLRSVWIDKHWLSEQMKELCASPIVHIKRIDNRGRVAGYVSSYCGKASQKFATAKRYWSSRDYDLRDKPEKPFKWKGDPFVVVSECPLHTWIAVHEKQGFQVERTSHFSATARPPPSRSGRWMA